MVWVDTLYVGTWTPRLGYPGLNLRISIMQNSRSLWALKVNDIRA